MQLSKPLLILCATVLSLSLSFATGDDTDAQIKARDALRTKLNELQTEPVPAVPAPATPAPATSQPKPVAKPKESAPKPKASKPAPVAKEKPASKPETGKVAPVPTPAPKPSTAPAGNASL